VRLEFSQATKKARWLHCHDSKGVPHCEYCGAEITEANPADYHHHKEAESGGDNSFQNCRVVCRKTCHKKETARFKTECAKADRSASYRSGLKRKYPWPRQKFKQRRFG